MKSLLLPATLLAFAATSLAPGLAADTGTAAGTKVYLISSQNGSGESGTVVLTPQGDKTKVDVAIAGVPSGIPQPAHVHTGTCSNLDPAPKYPLAPVKDGVSSTVVSVPLATLTGGGFAVNVHKSADDIKTYVACGNLGA
jgi:Cu/Zn superoxide dismutase